MPSKVTARSHSNIALCKYWGKLDLPRAEGEAWVDWRLRKINTPATPSISLSLAALTTETTVARLPDDAAQDEVLLDGAPADKGTHSRLSVYLNLWRAAGVVEGRFSIDSRNNFPTASGLASSASGYAALAKALSGFAAEPLSSMDLSRWARRGSGSAARSIYGGVSALPVGSDAAAYLAVPAEEAPFAMVVCIVAAPPKDVSSRDGMSRSAATSPFYKAWLKQSARDYDQIIESLWRGTRTSEIEPEDLLWRIGSVAERNCLAMHAVMQTSVPPLLYWAPGTLAAMHAVRAWRDEGGPHAYFTIDAGPHVELLCLRADAEEIARRAADVPGVAQVIASAPGGPAEIISAE
jgi:diphosphomevalonate decarboxylase